MTKRRLRNCSKCGVRHGPPFGKLCEKISEEFEELSAEMEGNKDGSTVSDKAEEKSEDVAGKPEEGINVSPPMPEQPIYQPLNGGEHIPLFQRQGGVGVQRRAWDDDLGYYQSRLFNLPERTSRVGLSTLQPHSEYQRQSASWPRPPVNHGAGFVGHPISGMNSPRPIGPDAMDFRLRKLEGLVERVVDLQQAQVLSEYNKSHGGQNGLPLAEGAVGGPISGASANAQSQSGSIVDSTDSESEIGEWTESDGRDLWKSTKEKRKRNPFDHANFNKKGEKVDSFEKIMIVTFKTIEQLLNMGKDVKGLVRHGLALSEKASTGFYKVDAFVSYDDSVRERAGRQGPSTFGVVNQDDVMRYFCVDNAERSRNAKASQSTGKKKSDKVCLKFNSDTGCTFRFCNFVHRCVACDDAGHSKKDCKAIKRKETK